MTHQKFRPDLASLTPVKVRSPDGQVWRVRRRWLPWRQRRRDVDFVDLSDFADDPVTWIALIVVSIVLAPVLIVLAAVLIAGLEFLLLLLVLPVAVLARVLFGRRWCVEVRRGRRLHQEVVGGDWQRSGLLVRDLASQIERGELVSIP